MPRITNYSKKGKEQLQIYHFRCQDFSMDVRMSGCQDICIYTLDMCITCMSYILMHTYVCI